jgi:putative PEP-CTERM system histidine kinase
MGVALERGAESRARAVAVIAVLLSIFAWSGWTLQSPAESSEDMEVLLGPLGRVDYLFVIFALAMALSHLEQVFRATREPLRYQLKLVLIGLGALGGYQIYQSSQFLVVPVWQSEYALAGGAATLTSVALIAYGAWRSQRHLNAEAVCAAPQTFYGSFSFILIGFYLLGVGLVGELVNYTGGSMNLALSMLVVFVALVALVVMVSSRAVRIAVTQVLLRHILRSKYDYRSKWLEVTEAFRNCGSDEAVLDQLLHVLSTTFAAPRISIWMPFEADGKFYRVRCANTEVAPPPLDAADPIVAALRSTDEPVDLAQPSTGGGPADAHMAFWKTTRAVLGVPVRSEDRLIAFVTLSPELSGQGYGQDDRDLLRAIAHHAAMLLSLVHLAEARRAATGMEALHRVSAFCLHDLKNLAARLSLVVQNAGVHGHDPAFHQSAMRTVAQTAKSMTALVGKLSLPTGDLESLPEGDVTDVHSIIDDTVRSVTGGVSVSVLNQADAFLQVRIDPNQLQQVLLNLVFNAAQACGSQGEIRIITKAEEGAAVIVVSDTGDGIAPSVLRTLFRPFRTTKHGGLGVGLYECKRIVEAYHGTIHVQSENGGGTAVMITLPLASHAMSG